MPIAAFLPDLHYAFQRKNAPQYRTSMQCVAHRGDGNTFTADVWFSTYMEELHPKLAAIITETADEISASGTGPFSKSSHGTLSARELDVLKLILRGLGNKEIAANIGISESAVKNALQQLFAKNGVRTRSQLVRVALEHYGKLL